MERKARWSKKYPKAKFTDVLALEAEFGTSDSENDALTAEEESLSNRMLAIENEVKAISTATPAAKTRQEIEANDDTQLLANWAGYVSSEDELEQAIDDESYTQQQTSETQHAYDHRQD